VLTEFIFRGLARSGPGVPFDERRVALAREEFAPKVIVWLEFARLWNACRVPLERLDVFDPECWARA
jgi:hypothetical protein